MLIWMKKYVPIFIAAFIDEGKKMNKESTKSMCDALEAYRWALSSRLNSPIITADKLLYAKLSTSITHLNEAINHMKNRLKD